MDPVGGPALDLQGSHRQLTADPANGNDGDSPDPVGPPASTRGRPRRRPNPPDGLFVAVPQPRQEHLADDSIDRRCENDRAYTSRPTLTSSAGPPCRHTKHLGLPATFVARAAPRRLHQHHRRIAVRFGHSDLYPARHWAGRLTVGATSCGEATGPWAGPEVGSRQGQDLNTGPLLSDAVADQRRAHDPDRLGSPNVAPVR
jgi:hypothetical protein